MSFLYMRFLSRHMMKIIILYKFLIVIELQQMHKILISFNSEYPIFNFTLSLIHDNEKRTCFNESRIAGFNKG